MRTYYIAYPKDNEKRLILNQLLQGLEAMYQVECLDVVAIKTDQPNLHGFLSGLATDVVEHRPPRAPKAVEEQAPKPRRARKQKQEPAPAVSPGVQIITDSVERQIARHGAIGGHKV
jgi:hypothetical protein